MDDFVDVIIPRGGRSLIDRVINESKVHVIRHLDGNFFDDMYAGEYVKVPIDGRFVSS